MDLRGMGMRWEEPPWSGERWRLQPRWRLQVVGRGGLVGCHTIGQHAQSLGGRHPEPLPPALIVSE